MAPRVSERRYAVEQIKGMLPLIDDKSAEDMYRATKAGCEIAQCGGVDNWLAERVSFSMVVLDADDYLTALTHALRLAPGLAPTDYGTSRQRDLGQLWTDVARGFLGEIGFAKFIKERFNHEVVLDYSQGPLENYLPSDITHIQLPDGTRQSPRLKLSIKTTKLGGIWLDIPGAQIDHSDIFILVKLGITREHFVAFLKHISVIKDKLLPTALQRNVIKQSEADKLWDSLPTFKAIPCYVAGFFDKRRMGPKSPEFREGKKKRVIYSYIGWVKSGEPDVQDVHLLTPKLPWHFESIGKFTTQAPHFVVNAGSLAYSEKEWKELLRDIVGEG